MTNKQLQEELAKYPDEAEIGFFNWDAVYESIRTITFEKTKDKFIIIMSDVF